MDASLDGDLDATGGDASTEDEIETFLRDRQSAACERTVRCEGDYGFPVGPFCHPSILEDWLAEVPPDASLNADDAAACLALLEGPCNGTPHEVFTVGPCSTAVRGAAEEGDACDPDAASTRRPCAEGLRCPFAGCQRCVPQRTLGERCDTFEDCAAPLACMFATDGSRRCLRPRVLGDACGDDDACVASDTDFWRRGACLDGVCRFAREGESCGPLAECAEGLHCSLDGVCAPPGELGDPCGACRDDWVCIAGTCAEPPRTEGGACRLPSHCAAPARFCVAGVCSTNQNGATCAVDSECSQGGRCRDGRCVQLVNVGEPCQLFFPDFYCPAGARCEDGVCRRQVLPTEPCDETSLCPHGFACVEGECEALPTQGQPCSDACATGACRDGVCGLGEADDACTFGAFRPTRSFEECEHGCEGTRCGSTPSELGQPCRTCVEGAVCAAYPEGPVCVDATCE